jgi:hypothetical protein
MHRRSVLAGLTAALALAAGCGTSTDSASVAASSVSSGSSASAAVCSSAADLRTSLGTLQEVDVVARGTGALEDAFTAVQSDLAQLAKDAQAQYTEQVQQVQSDAAAVQHAVDAAQATATAQTLGTVATAVRTLVPDAQALVTAVTSTC